MTVAIAQLQSTLAQLSAASGNPRINPGAVDGIIGAKTRSATSEALSYIAPKLPRQELKYAMQGLALAVAAAGPSADKIIAERASEISGAINIVLALLHDNTGIAPGASPWYLTTKGILGITAGVVGLLGIIAVMTVKRTA